MKQQDIFASSQIIVFNPILKENREIQIQYFTYLRKLIRLVNWDKSKYTKAQLTFYKKILCSGDHSTYSRKKIQLNNHLCYLIPYDLTLMLAFHKKINRTPKIATIIEKIVHDFNLPIEATEFFYREFDAALGDKEAWDEVLNNKVISRYKRYLKIVRENSFFINRRSYNVLITATMSAGKSTLINAFVGKTVSRMQNMACTSKIHSIVSKPFEDGVSSERDYDLSMNASNEELLNDNEENHSTRIIVGTYFNSDLGGCRVTLLDSPGINYSENEEHREISHKLIRARKYNILLYVMNATQLGTNDEDQHLSFIKEHLGRFRILFIMNKIDNLISEDDNIAKAIENQRRFLCAKGFKNPIICPVSSRAAFLAKKSRVEGLDRIERREMNHYIDKFELNSMADYYENILHCSKIANSNDEAESMLRNCGFSYLEQMMAHLSDGGKINGTGLC